MYKRCKIVSTLDRREEMRAGDEFGRESSERSGMRERKRGSGEEREIIRVGQVESVKLIIEVN